MRLRVVALLMGALLLAAAPALAQTQTFVGKSSATAFELSITPPGEETAEGLIVGVTESGVQSGGDQACDEGETACAFAEALLGFSGAAETSQPGGEETASAVGGELPEDFAQLLTARFGVAESASSADPQQGSATAAASEISVTLTETLFSEENLGQVTEPIKEGIDQLTGPISEGDPSGEVGPRLKGLVDYVFENLGSAALANIAIGPTASSSTHSGGTTVATATAQGAVVTLLPPPLDSEVAELAPDGLAQVVIGESSASATTDGETGTPEASSSVVTLRLFDPATQEYEEFPVEPGVRDCSPEELEPLRVCVSLGGTETETEGAGALAVADSVMVELFDGEDLPLIRLAVASAEAAVNAAVPAEPEPQPDLPRTGANHLVAGLAFLGAGTLTAAGAAVRRRRR
jgi:hypothetical protein